MSRSHAFVLLVAALLCATPGCSPRTAPSVAAATIEVPLRPHRPTDDPEVRPGLEASSVAFVAGAEIVAIPPLLNGVSTTALGADTLTLFSDRGGARYDLAFDGCRIAASGFPERLVGRRSAVAGGLRDLEASAVAGGALWLGRDGDGRLLRLDRADTTAGIALRGYVDCPNAGIEALAALPGGRLLAIAEEQRPSGRCSGDGRAAWIVDPASGAPPSRLRYDAPGGVSPSGAATLPDGSVVVLHRQYSHSERTQRLVLARLGAEILDGERDALAPEILFDLTDRLPSTARPDEVHAFDNMEALEAFACGARTYLLVASDDNSRRCDPERAEVGCQKALLLLFELR